MKLRFYFLSVFLCLCMMIVGAAVNSAQELQPLEPEWLRQMYEEGWQKIQAGVLQRDTGGGKLETFSYGAEGLQWVIQNYEQQLGYFEDKYDESPTEEIAELIEQLRSKVHSLNGDLQIAPSAASFDGEVLEGCSFSYDAATYAGPQESPRGVKATANAYFHNDCGYIGHTTAYAFAHATDGTLETTNTQMDPKNDGVWLDSFATAAASGSIDCESIAQATVEIPQLGIFYAAPPAENYSCLFDDPVSIEITGPTQVATDDYGTTCADVTWTANGTGGHPGGYTYNWYIGTDPTVQGTGSTFTKSYCNTSQSVTVKVVAQDADGHTDDATFTTTIQHTGPIVASVSGPTTVITDAYSSSCADVTWTVSATEGHPGGYTYSWYIGTSTTVQGTGSTFTKNYCSTSQLLTVKVIARDSDGHTDDATFTTSISHRASIRARISGPTSVSTSISSPCTTVTWTATATGAGHSGFTYNWYIGTALQASGATFSKQYCNTSQSVTVNVVALASDGHQDSERYTTTIAHNKLTASISGPVAVKLSTAGECRSLTWTASATGGTPGYTYSWYIGTNTTVEGTGTTLTKTYCGTQTVDVKVTVQDAAAQTHNGTFSTRLSSDPNFCIFAPCS